MRGSMKPVSAGRATMSSSRRVRCLALQGHRRRRRLVGAQLAADGEPAQGQRAAAVAEHLPGPDEDGGAVAGQRQQHALAAVEAVAEVLVDGVLGAAGEQGVGQLAAPGVEPGLQGLGAGAVAGAGEFDVALQVPGQLVQVGLGERQGDGEGVAVLVPGGLEAVALLPDPQAVLGGWRGRRCRAGGRVGGDAPDQRGDGLVEGRLRRVGREAHVIVLLQKQRQRGGAREQDRYHRLALVAGQAQRRGHLLAMHRAEAVGAEQHGDGGAVRERGLHRRQPGPPGRDLLLVDPDPDAAGLEGRDHGRGRGGVAAVVADEDLCVGHGGSSQVAGGVAGGHCRKGWRAVHGVA